MCEKLSAAGVDMIEVNISCPNVKAGGLAYGTRPELAAEVTEIAKKNSTVPVMVKLSPNVTDITEIARAVEEAGADAISLINTIRGMRIDVNTRRPILKMNTGGLSGPAVLPVAVRMVWETANAVKIPILGMGGVSKGTDAAELMLAGAAAVAVLFGVSAGVRAVQLSAPERASYLAWQAARTQAVDYGGLAAAEAEALEAAGLTPEMAELALSGCLLDASVTTEALAALEPPEEAHTSQETLETLRVLFRRSRGAYWACAALAGLCALAALLALAGPRGSRLWRFLASAGVGLAAAAMLLYLAWMARLPARAAMTVLLPAVALALWLVLHGAAGLWTSGSGAGRAAAVAAVLVGAAMLAPCARAAYHSTYNPDPAQGESACTRLERYALAHGDRLFIADPFLSDRISAACSSTSS